MAQLIFVNLPVKDLQRSTDFYLALGFTKNSDYSGDTASCIVISDTIFVMLLVEEFFATFTKKPIADSTSTTEVINALSTESKEEVDDFVRKALAAGGSPSNDPITGTPGMYGWSFQDPDGHLWELVYTDEQA